MCGRFDLTASIREIASELAAIPVGDFQPCYNIPPAHQILALRRQGTIGRQLAMMQWGIRPRWAKKDIINAMGETAANKPTFRKAFTAQRCIIPATGFFEWKRINKQPKEPYRIVPKNHKLLAFAGLWFPADSKIPDSPDRCVIITIEPNSIMAPIHDRMPVILAESAVDIWLDSDAQHQQLQDLMTPCPDTSIEAYRVSTVVNRATNNVPACIERLS